MGAPAPSFQTDKSFVGSNLTADQYKTLTPDQQVFLQGQMAATNAAAKGKDSGLEVQSGIREKALSDLTGIHGDPNVKPLDAPPPQPDLTDALVKAYQYGQVQNKITGSRKASLLTDASPLSNTSLPSSSSGAGKTTLGG